MKNIYVLILILLTSLLATQTYSFNFGSAISGAGRVSERAAENRAKGQEQALRSLDIRNRQLENERLQLEYKYQQFDN